MTVSFNSNYSSISDDEEPQNNHNHPGKFSHCFDADADLLFISKELTMLSCFSLPHFPFFTSLPMTPFLFSYLYVYSYHLISSLSNPKHPMASAPPPRLVFQSAKRGFTVRCWSLWPAVNVHPTVWPGRPEPLLAVVRMDTIRSTRTLQIWLAHVRIQHLYICTCLLLI